FYELLTRRLPGRRSPMPSDIDPKLPKGLDDIFDTMTRDSQAERYAMVDDILDDFDKLEGLNSVLDNQTHALVTDNPLKDIVFRPAWGRAGRLAGETEGEGGEGGGDVLSSAGGEFSDDDSSRKRRPYSFQQRQQKKP